MTKLRDMVHEDQYTGGAAFVRFACDAAGNWTDHNGQSVGTSATSGILKLKGPGSYMCTSAAADAAAIVYLPAAASCPKGTVLIWAPTGATAGDISVYSEETGAEVATVGDLDADNDRCTYVSNGLDWLDVHEVVA